MTWRVSCAGSLRSIRKVRTTVLGSCCGSSSFGSSALMGFLFSLPEPSLPKPSHIFAKVDRDSLSASFCACLTFGTRALASVLDGSISMTRSRSRKAAACSPRENWALERRNIALTLCGSSLSTSLQQLSALVGSFSCSQTAALFSSQTCVSSFARPLASSDQLLVSRTSSCAFLYLSKASSKRFALKSFPPISFRSRALSNLSS
mmetsp:Transcript_21409/g.54572  ORF Transcript_21409/g.54572 Transcript_21409/m.54572 type:complete len:205 (-) Transcript_21409:1168-1782(-)